jgi:hypothetical protein
MRLEQIKQLVGDNRLSPGESHRFHFFRLAERLPGQNKAIRTAYLQDIVSSAIPTHVQFADCNFRLTLQKMNQLMRSLGQIEDPHDRI